MQHMLLLKVRDTQSKMPEINNTHVCLAELHLYKCAVRTGAQSQTPEMQLNCKHPFLRDFGWEGLFSTYYCYLGVCGGA